MNQDLEHLRLLSIFHYVVAAVTALFACLPFIHFFIGLAMLLGWGDFGQGDAGSHWPGWILVGVATVLILLGWAYALCLAFAGKALAHRRRYTFCLVMAAISCLFMPFGTVLGVFTLIVLMRPSVKALFEPGLAEASSPAV